MIDETRVRIAAFSLTSRFEGGSYHTYQNHDAGIISYGRFQFTLASGALGRIVTKYLAQSTTPIALELRAFHNRIMARDASLRPEQRLRELLIAAAHEPVMQQIQDDEAVDQYWEPTKRIAIIPRGLQTPLAWAFLFDISIHFGVGDGFLRIAESELGVPVRSPIIQNGLTEAQLITRVAELRKQSHDRQAERDNLPGLRIRGDFWLNLVRQGDWQLLGDANGNILVKGHPVQVRDPQSIPDDDIPGELDPQRFYITPTADRIRIRVRPVDGDLVGFVSRGEILEVLESYAEAARKIGVENQWIQVRTAEGIEGYTAAWFYAIHQLPEPLPEQPPAPQPPVIPTPKPEDPILITPIEDRIRIRTRPVDGEPTSSVSRGDVLEVLEPRGAALQKIGAQNQWLYVRLPDGNEGYTAAWYYTIYRPPVPAPPPEPEPPQPVPAPTPEELLLITPTDDRVRIRTRPVDGEPIRLVFRGDLLQVLEPRIDAMAKIGVQDQWLHVRASDGTEGYTAAWFYTVYQLPSPEPPPPPPADPAPGTPLLVTPTADQIRIRASPVDGEQMGLTSRGDVLRVLEPRSTAFPKVGIKDEWLHVLAPDGTEGYVAAWFFTVFVGRLPDKTIQANMTGMNLDIFHPLGRPDPARLANIGWVRLVYNVSLDPGKPQHDPTRYGNTNLDATYRRYWPLLEHYARSGIKVLLVLTHQTFGEAAEYNWEHMNPALWHDLTEKFADMAGRIALQFQGKKVVHAYQIWNEMDAHSGARASVPMPPEIYANLFAQAARAIRSVDPEALVITGGHTGGPNLGVEYARRMLQALPGDDDRPDGLAIHPYGRGTSRSDPRFRPHGSIDDEINAFAALMPGWPVWITEWGVLDMPDESPELVADYAREVVARLKGLYAHKVAAAIWYAWAQGMDNGYGLVDQHDRSRGRLTSEFVML